MTGRTKKGERKQPRRKRKLKSNMKAKLHLKCYCCGEILTDIIALVITGEEADRVFVFKEEHAYKAQGTWEVVSRDGGVTPGKLKAGMYE